MERNNIPSLWLLMALLSGACSGPSQQLRGGGGASGASLEQRRQQAQLPMARLRAGEFEAAQLDAARVLAADPANPYALLVSAITRYKATMHLLSTDARTVLFGALRAGGLNHRYMRSSLTETEKALAEVEGELSRAWASPGVDLELCLACWEVDWNHNGRIDSGDRWLFAIELDAKGERIPEDDQRRRPTFRFDHGDIAWARAFVAFQRAALNIVLAYQWTELDRFLGRRREKDPQSLRLKLDNPGLIATARRQILDGLDRAEEARRAYLAEKDDDREWLPNPRQKDHPMPLPVDDALYRTWEQVLRDLRRLVRGEEGLGVAELAQLGDHKWETPPGGFVDIGRMLSSPRDIVFDLGELEKLDRRENQDVEAMLRSILGEYYRAGMKATPLISRLARMKQEVDRGQESLERKLRYLFWLN